MTAAALIGELRAVGATVCVLDGRVRVEAPRGVLTPELRDAFVLHKDALVALLAAEAVDARIRRMWDALVELPARRPIEDAERAELANQDIRPLPTDGARVDAAGKGVEIGGRRSVTMTTGPPAAARQQGDEVRHDASAASCPSAPSAR